MKKWMILMLACLSCLAVASAVTARHSHSASRSVLQFHAMYGVDGVLIGDQNPIRGIPGDELPWDIGPATNGRLDSNGRLRIHVDNLVFANDPSVPPELRGTNDEAFFRAVVSCLTVDSGGNVVTSNQTTAGFPATVTGQCTIDTTVDLPSPCIAPVVFVIAGSEDKWFAVSGVETN
jgi:hypothetical protein